MGTRILEGVLFPNGDLYLGSTAALPIWLFPARQPSDVNNDPWILTRAMELVFSVRGRAYFDHSTDALGELERQVNRLIRSSNAHLQERLLFAIGPVVVFCWQSREGWPVDYVSSNVEDLTGYPVDEFASGHRAYATLIHKDDLAHVVEEVTSNSTSDVAWFVHQPYRILRADGKALWVADYTVISLFAWAGVVGPFASWVAGTIGPSWSNRPTTERGGVRTNRADTSSPRRPRRGPGCAAKPPSPLPPGASRPSRGAATPAPCTAPGRSRRAGAPWRAGRPKGW